MDTVLGIIGGGLIGMGIFALGYFTRYFTEDRHARS